MGDKYKWSELLSLEINKVCDYCLEKCEELFYMDNGYYACDVCKEWIEGLRDKEE